MILPGLLCTMMVLTTPHAEPVGKGSETVLTSREYEPPRYDAALLAQALRARLTYPSSLKRGRPYYMWHCRKAYHGCPARVQALAAIMVSAGRATGVSPWLLAAMAMVETGANPFAVGKGGEIGILQLHPKRKDAQKLRFLKDEAYRERCKKIVGACQEEIIALAATILRRAIRKCGNSTDRGLIMYNAGRCNAQIVYVYRVDKELQRLYGYARKAAAT